MTVTNASRSSRWARAKHRDLDVLVRRGAPRRRLLTNVGEAHLEIMGTLERIARDEVGAAGRLSPRGPEPG